MSGRPILLVSLAFFLSGIVLITPEAERLLINFINHLLQADLDTAFRSYGLFYCGALLITLSLCHVWLYLFREKNINRGQFIALAIGTVIAFYFFFLFNYAVNIPITDDFRILRFLSTYTGTHTPGEKYELFMRPMREAAIREVPKFFTISVIEIFGAVNFKYILLANGCIYLFICFLLVHFFCNPSGKIKAAGFIEKGGVLLAFSFLFFQFQSFDSAFWTDAGIIYYWTILFALLAIYFAGRNTRSSFWFSMALSVLAAFTLSNGLFSFLACGFIYFIRREIANAVGMLVAMLMVYSVFIFISPYDIAMSEWHYHPLDIFVFAIGFLGSAMQFFYTLHLPLATGLFCLATFLYATIKKYYLRNYFIYAALLFMILTAFATAPMRIATGPLASRYGIFSIITIVLTIMVLHDLFKERGSFFLRSPFLLGVAILYNAGTGIMFYPEVPVRKEKLEHFIHAWKNHEPFTYHNDPVIIEGAYQCLDEAEKTGVWHY